MKWLHIWGQHDRMITTLYWDFRLYWYLYIHPAMIFESITLLKTENEFQEWNRGLLSNPVGSDVGNGDGDWPERESNQMKLFHFWLNNTLHLFTPVSYSLKYKVRGVSALHPSKEELKDDVTYQYTPKRR